MWKWGRWYVYRARRKWKARLGDVSERADAIGRLHQTNAHNGRQKAIAIVRFHHIAAPYICAYTRSNTPRTAEQIFHVTSEQPTYHFIAVKATPLCCCHARRHFYAGHNDFQR